MKDIIENSIKSAGLSETEVAEWVVNLKSYHDEEGKRRGERNEELLELVELYDSAAKNLNSAAGYLDQKVGALAQLEVQVAQERQELRKVKQDLQRERQLLGEAIRELKPGWLKQFVVPFVAALSALVLFLVALWVAPDVLRWIGALFF